MIGRQIDGRYQVLSKLGEGAMGEVYLVEHLGLGRKEAIKILHAALDSDADMMGRFRREARATNRLQHPNIVCVYDFGQLPDGRLFITTEYAEGESLEVMLHRLGPFPVPRALHVLAQLADAVDHAHSRGVIHRDLKPANLILIERRGQADVLKVLDFGIAKIIAPDYAETMVTTKQGQVFGTPAYMAPEQVSGQGNDPRIDLYAIGCVGHELIVGAPPFGGKTIEIMSAHLGRPAPRPSERRREAGIPRELDEVILRLLEKDPDRRFQTGRDVVAALRKVPNFPDERPASGRRHRSSTPAMFLDGSATVPGGVHDFDHGADTGVGGPSPLATAHTLHGKPDDVALLMTAQVDPDAARASVEEALLQLAESLIDHGYHDTHLSMTVAQIAVVRGDRDDIVGRMSDLERAGDDAEQRGREVEARLSFAIGEMRFDCERVRAAHGVVESDVLFQLAQLERRHAEVVAQRERELSDITDRAIGLAAERATREDELAALYVALARVVDEHAARVADDPVVAELGRRLARTRSVLRIAERGAR